MATTRLMPLHIGKGRNAGTAIARIIDYVANPEKGYSSHSRGNTVDVTLVTSAGELVEIKSFGKLIGELLFQLLQIMVQQEGLFAMEEIEPAGPFLPDLLLEDLYVVASGLLFLGHGVTPL